MSPRFSITIPAYNAASTLRETIQSVMDQTFDNWEVVIVDDGSTDGTRSLAEGLASANPRIRVIAQENRGSGGAYNTAVRNAHADLLVMLSADDLLLPTHLEVFNASIEQHPEASVFTSDGFYLYDDGRRERAHPETGWATPSGCTLAELLSACFYGVGATYRRDVFAAVDGFRENIYAEDYLFWLQALAAGFTHRYIAQPLAVHRRNATQKSADAIRMRETDMRVVETLVATGVLSGAESTAARLSIARLHRNIRIRKIGSRLLGPATFERLVDTRRARRRPQTDGSDR